MRHSRAEGEGTEAEESEKDEQIREQFVLGSEGLPDGEQWLIEEAPLEEALQFSPKDKWEWLLDIKEARSCEEQRQTSSIGRMQDGMRQWLERTGDEGA